MKILLLQIWKMYLRTIVRNGHIYKMRQLFLGKEVCYPKVITYNTHTVYIYIYINKYYLLSHSKEAVN